MASEVAAARLETLSNWNGCVLSSVPTPAPSTATARPHHDGGPDHQFAEHQQPQSEPGHELHAEQVDHAGADGEHAQQHQ